MNRLHIVLTGVTRGLGRALLDRFVEKGHIVNGCGRNESHIQELRNRFASPHHFSVVDVSLDSVVREWATEVLAQYDPPDLLINNAAVMNPMKRLWELAADEFDPVMDVNIKGVANVIRHFVPAMIRRAKGIIVNLSSGWGRSTSPEVAPYCASKYAIEGMSKAMAEELPKGMACIPLNPGIIDTDMLRSCFQESSSHYPDAKHWSYRAADYILNLSPSDNGLSKTVRL